jgi:hypothetical protein
MTTIAAFARVAKILGKCGFPRSEALCFAAAIVIALVTSRVPTRLRWVSSLITERERAPTKANHPKERGAKPQTYGLV